MLTKNSTVIILSNARPDLLKEYGSDYTGKRGTVLGVQKDTGNVLVKVKGHSWPIIFKQTDLITEEK